MARSTRRRSSRANPQSPPASPKESAASRTPETTESAQHHGNDESCPACTPETRERISGSRKESWIECDNCNTWYHWRCAGNDENMENIAKWYCAPCTQVDPTRIMTLKAPARKSARKRTQRNYANLNSGLGSDPNRWQRMIESKEFKKDPFRRMQGSELESWLQEDETALREPIVIEQPDGLGMKMPPRDLTVEHVAEYIGEDTPLEVIDVASQSTAPGWNLGKWADYIELDSSKREKIFNVISLEISGTELADMVLPPKIVRDLDWVENFWPSTRKGKNNAYPKVQLYCLMGVANAWTDWHIDFAGSSVYYHILHGSKIFYFIRPTPANLAAYEKWSGSEIQNQTWLGDMVDEVFKVELVEGNTMIIPTGWIHAVFTPVDTLVFGGNFLHSYDVATQLRVREIEIATQVPRKFTFPMFTKFVFFIIPQPYISIINISDRLCWYVGDKYLRDLKALSGASFSLRVLNGVLTLSEFLVAEARILEKGTEQAKKEAKEQIPSDRVKDAPAMARELRWRTKQALGYSSDDEGAGGSKMQKHLTNPPASFKRRRVEDEDETSHFRHFKPKAWDAIVTNKEEEQILSAKMPNAERKDEEDWTSDWVAGPEPTIEGDAVDGKVKRRREVMMKVRRTASGKVERQRIERTVEEWSAE
ncbi:JmjC domain-containing histone demethylation protein 1 [Pholiota conissans]|uniref:JmjC domain-containing histone demethylation protein 1 n=1 Tax=Pholiota conissans TaxID=109636 RepID=A0A9P5YNV0_9AGAR|nr:JmjC domain-containing histone demethylation protein 1 [Pholiota conissans]